jgi:HlyD family secretion protein
MRDRQANMKRLATILILLAVAAFGAYYFFYSETEEPPQILRAVVSRATVAQTVQATGTLEAVLTVSVGPQVSGVISDLYADFNSIVRKGQVVARLDPSLLQTQVDVQMANIERQQTDIEMQQVQLEDAERQLKRTQELFEKGLANQTQLEQAELAVKTRVAQIASAEKQLVQARANLAQAQLNVSYTEVRSPIDGVVVNRLVDVGQSVQSSMNITPFFEIATDLSTLRLVAGVDEADIGSIRPGMPVEFTVDTFPNARFRGTVESVNLNATVQSNVVTYPVWITVPNPDYRLVPQMTANIEIIVSTAENALRVPNSALRFRPNAEMFAALGLEMPEMPMMGRPGGSGRAGGRGDAAAASAAAPAPPAAGEAPEAVTNGRAARNGGANGERAGFPGGRGGMRGRAGNGASAQAAAAPSPSLTSAQKIDDLFAPFVLQPQPGMVWVWNEEERTLTPVPVTTGISDGQFSQLLSGDLTEGQEVVTNIILPTAGVSAASQQQTIFGGGNRGGGFGNRGGGFGGRGGF